MMWDLECKIEYKETVRVRVQTVRQTATLVKEGAASLIWTLAVFAFTLPRLSWSIGMDDHRQGSCSCCISMGSIRLAGGSAPQAAVGESRRLHGECKGALHRPIASHRRNDPALDC